jgi:LPPG:FO 2-phospho-L-lactate transferase
MVRVVQPSTLTVVANTGDDMVLHGLHISPDLDTLLYTLAGLNNAETGWGVANETWSVMDSLEKLGGQTWFRLGDVDLATHLYRTQRMTEGASLSEVTAELFERHHVLARVVPMSDSPVRTRVTVSGTTSGDGWFGTGGEEVEFQEYFVRLAHRATVSALRFDGAETASPAPGVLDAIAAADQIVVCPSNPLVSIGPILAVPGIKDALIARRDDVIAVSPIVGGRALKGPADHMMAELGHQPSSLGVARLYSDWVATLVVDERDAHLRSEIEDEGLACIVTDTVMTDVDVAARVCSQITATRDGDAVLR